MSCGGGGGTLGFSIKMMNQSASSSYSGTAGPALTTSVLYYSSFLFRVAGCTLAAARASPPPNLLGELSDQLTSAAQRRRWFCRRGRADGRTNLSLILSCCPACLPASAAANRPAASPLTHSPVVLPVEPLPSFFPLARNLPRRRRAGEAGCNLTQDDVSLSKQGATQRT